MSMLLSLCPSSPSPPCPQVHSLCLRLYSRPATRFISTIFLYPNQFYYIGASLLIPRKPGTWLSSLGETMLVRGGDSRAKCFGSRNCTLLFKDTFHFSRMSVNKPTQPPRNRNRTLLLSTNTPWNKLYPTLLFSILAEWGSFLWGQRKQLESFLSWFNLEFRLGW